MGVSGKSANDGAVIYGRNSSAKQKSIDDQQAENRAATEANGWTVVAELDDPSSASRYATKVRRNWARLLELLPAIDVVVLWEPSRGDRTLATWVAFLDACREHRVRIHAVTHNRTYDPRNPRDYRSLAEDGVDSAYESDKISGRTRRRRTATCAGTTRPRGRFSSSCRTRNTLPSCATSSSRSPGASRCTGLCGASTAPSGWGRCRSRWTRWRARVGSTGGGSACCRTSRPDRSRLPGLVPAVLRLPRPVRRRMTPRHCRVVHHRESLRYQQVCR
jgi:hypothetical protein